VSISGYFQKSDERRMPRREGRDPVTGIRFVGNCMTGKTSVRDALQHDAVLAARGNWPTAPASEELDPVLRCHLRRPAPQP